MNPTGFNEFSTATSRTEQKRGFVGIVPCLCGNIISNFFILLPLFFYLFLKLTPIIYNTSSFLSSIISIFNNPFFTYYSGFNSLFPLTINPIFPILPFDAIFPLYSFDEIYKLLSFTE